MGIAAVVEHPVQNDLQTAGVRLLNESCQQGVRGLQIFL